MPSTTCILCHDIVRLTADELDRHEVPTVGRDCRDWLAKGLGLPDLSGIAFSLEQAVMIYCLEAAVDAGYVGQAARDEADRMIGTVLKDLCRLYDAKVNTLPVTNGPSKETS